MRRLPPRLPVRAVLTTLKGTALGLLLSLVVVGALRTEAADSTANTPTASDAYQRVVERAVAAHGCSYRGFGDGRVPASALIRTPRGAVRQVTFKVAWDVYNGRRPGTLIAVCLDRSDKRRLVSVSGG